MLNRIRALFPRAVRKYIYSVSVAVIAFLVGIEVLAPTALPLALPLLLALLNIEPATKPKPRKRAPRKPPAEAVPED